MLSRPGAEQGHGKKGESDCSLSRLSVRGTAVTRYARDRCGLEASCVDHLAELV